MAVSPFDVVLALRTTNSIIRLARILPACCYRRKKQRCPHRLGNSLPVRTHGLCCIGHLGVRGVGQPASPVRPHCDEEGARLLTASGGRKSGQDLLVVRPLRDALRLFDLLRLAQCNPPRIASFVTNGAFSRPITTRQQEQQQDPFVYKRVSADINGGGGGGGLGGSHLLTDFPARAQCRRQRLRLRIKTEASWRLWLTR